MVADEKTFGFCQGGNILKEVRQKVDSLNALAWDLELVDPERAILLSEQAFHLSSTDGFAKEPYLKGKADSLCNLAHVNLDIGNYSLALNQSFDALSLYRKIADAEKEAIMLRNIGGIYCAINEYASAMDTLLEALTLSESLKFLDVKGEVLLNIGTVYLLIGNYSHALKEYEKVLEIALGTKNKTLEAFVLCNMTSVYVGLSDHENTKKTFERCLKISRETQNKLIQMNVLTQMGHEYLNQEDSVRAEECFRQSFELSKNAGFKNEEASSLVGLGKIYLQKREYEKSQEIFQTAKQLSEQLKDKNLLIECYKGFSQIYQALGNFENALDQCKRYYDTRQSLSDRINDQKIRTLEVAYRTERAQKEAEIARLKNIELEKEIAERKRIEKALRKSEEQYRLLAAIDPLTGINNRRHFFELAQREVSRARRFNHPLTAIMVDIDHFKKINDTFGHHRGDEVLKQCTDLIKDCLREMDIVGRYGGEEFSILLPETNLQQGIRVAKRLVQILRETPLQVGTDVAFVTLSVGVTELRGEMDLDTLIDEADHAMYSAKNAGRNRFVVWSRP